MGAHDIKYTDISPPMVKAAHQQNFTLLCDDCVQYEEIRHNVEATLTVCEAPHTVETSGNIIIIC